MDSLRIVSIKAYRYQLALEEMTTAHGKLAVREGALLELSIEDGSSGWGEVAPLPAFGGGTLDNALVALATFVPQVYGNTLARALAHLHDLRAQLPAALICGLEIALLDALGKSMGRSVASVLKGYSGPVQSLATREIQLRSLIPVNAVCGGASTALAVEQARAAVAAGFSCIKLKMGGQEPAADVERVAAVRAAVGPAVHLRLDANESWTFKQACLVLERCAAYDIQYVEQPLPAANLREMCVLREAVPIPIAADEALCDQASVRAVLAARAADILVIKPQMVGGLLAGLRIIQESTRMDVRCVVTSALESGVGIAGALHLVAASPDVMLECGLATLSLLSDDLLQVGLAIHAGMMTVPIGPGLGVQPDRAICQELSIC